MSEEAGQVSPGAWEVIKIIRALAAKDNAPDLIAVQMVQEIADIVDRARGRIPDDDCAVLIGIGSVIMKQAEAEMKAMFDAIRLMPKRGGQ